MWEAIKSAIRIIFFTVMIVLFGWSLVGSNPVWLFFMIYIAVSYATNEIDDIVDQKKKK